MVGALSYWFAFGVLVEAIGRGCEWLLSHKSTITRLAVHLATIIPISLGLVALTGSSPFIEGPWPILVGFATGTLVATALFRWVRARKRNSLKEE